MNKLGVSLLLILYKLKSPFTGTPSSSSAPIHPPTIFRARRQQHTFYGQPGLADSIPPAIESPSIHPSIHPWLHTCDREIHVLGVHCGSPKVPCTHVPLIVRDQNRQSVFDFSVLNLRWASNDEHRGQTRPGWARWRIPLPQYGFIFWFCPSSPSGYLDRHARVWAEGADVRWLRESFRRNPPCYVYNM